jgi:hypothetical protein
MVARMRGQEENARSHLALSIAARPHRLAVLVPVGVEGWDWRRTFEAAIAAQTRVWGGSGNLVLPLPADGIGRHECFWRIAEVFDPDAFVTYMPTIRESEEIAPQEFESRRDQVRRKMEAAGNDPEEIARFLAEDDERRWLAIEPEKTELPPIRDRLAPFHFHDETLWTFDGIDGGTGNNWPSVDITELKGLPDRVLTRSLGEDPTRELLLTANLGRVTPILAERLAEKGVEIAEMRAGLDAVVRDRWRAHDDDIYPRDLSNHGLSTYMRGSALRYPGAVVVGDEPWDFALFHALHQLTASAWWMPSELAADRHFMRSLRSALEHGRTATKRALIVSISAPERCEQVADELASGARKPICRAADWREALPEEPRRLYAIDAEGLVRTVSADDGTVRELETPEPPHVGCENPADLRWVAEVRCPDWAAIRHPAVAAAVLRDPECDSDRRRVGREGISYLATRAFVHVRASLPSIIVRPELRAIPLLTQLQAILEPQGWRIEPSDKGVYAGRSARLLGGFEELCDALRDPAFRAMVGAFRAPAKPRAPGHFLRSDSRRYLRRVDLDAALGVGEADRRADELIERRVLARGVVLRCATCRSQAWHPLARVGETFYCSRCGDEQPLLRGAWGREPEPVWSYRLAEVVHQLFEHDGELPLLAVAERFAGSERPLSQAFELKFLKGDVDKELDIACASGSRLVIGEATVTGHLDAERFEFLRRLAEATGAREVLLATSQETWSEGTERRAAEAFPGVWPEVVLRTGVDTGPRTPDGAG